MNVSLGRPIWDASSGTPYLGRFIWAMNLGQHLGELNLRIMQLEDELEARGRPRHVPVPEARAPQPVPVLVASTAASTDAPRVVHEKVLPPPRGGNNRGVGRRIHAVLPDQPPGETVSEIAAILGDVKPKNVAAWVYHFDDIARTGARGSYRYYRKAAA